MEIILNDIAWKHKCSDKYTAIKNIKVAVEGVNLRQNIILDSCLVKMKKFFHKNIRR